MTFDEIFFVLNEFSDDELENLDEYTLIEHITNNDSHENL
jgi:hypothetical protein